MLAQAPLRALLRGLSRRRAGVGGLAPHALLVVGPEGGWVDESLFTDEEVEEAERVRAAVALARPTGTAQEALAALVRCLWPAAEPARARATTRTEAIQEVHALLEAQSYFGHPWPYPDVGSLLDALPQEELWLVSSSFQTCSGEQCEVLLLARDADATTLFVQATTPR